MANHSGILLSIVGQSISPFMRKGNTVLRPAPVTGSSPPRACDGCVTPTLGHTVLRQAVQTQFLSAQEIPSSPRFNE